jgi:hypothetical protein
MYIGKKTLYDKQAAKHKKKFQGPTLIINVNKYGKTYLTQTLNEIESCIS